MTRICRRNQAVLCVPDCEGGIPLTKEAQVDYMAAARSDAKRSQTTRGRAARHRMLLRSLVEQAITEEMTNKGVEVPPCLRTTEM